jgi:type IV pilus assembly protein PilF
MTSRLGAKQWDMMAKGLAALALLAAIGVSWPVPAAAQAAGDRTTNSDETEPQRRARIRMQLASSYYADNQLQTALDQVKQALQAIPDLPEAFNLRGLIYSALGDDALAAESFRRALELRPQDGDTLHNFGFFLCQRGRYAEADENFNRALNVAQYRSTTRTLLVQGVCQSRGGDLVRAEATLTRAYELDAGNPATAMNLADVLYRRGEFERARFYVRRVNGQTDLQNAESLWLAARIERKMGNDSGARDYGNQLRDRYPQSREAAAFGRGSFDE